MNVLEIHNKITRYFESRQDKIPLLEKRLAILFEISPSNNIINDEIESLKKSIKSIQNNQDYIFYQLLITPLLAKYKEELNKPVRMNFMGEPITIDNTIRNEIEKHILEITKKYNVHVIENDDESSLEEFICQYCSCEQLEMLDHIIVCRDCGIEQDKFYSTFSYKDIDRVNITTKYTYNRSVHFRDCINQFQGKQNSTISVQVYEELERVLQSHNLVDNDAKSKYDKYKKVTKKILIMFLKEAGFSKHYEDINLIYHNITDQKIDDISHLEEQLMKDFDELSDAYDKEYVQNQNISRKSFINTQYVLFQLLKRHKYPCRREDFNFLKTTEKKNFHDQICSHLFRKLGWNFTNVF